MTWTISTGLWPRRAIQDLSHLNVRPPTTTRRGDLARVELPSDCIAAGVTGGLDLSDDWQHVGRKTSCFCFQRGVHSLYSALWIGSAKPLTPGLRRCKRRFGAL